MIDTINLNGKQLDPDEFEVTKYSEEGIPIAFELDEAGNFEFRVPPYRPGKVKLETVYDLNRGFQTSRNVELQECGNEQFYINVFVGIITSMLPPGEEKYINLSFSSPEVKQDFLKHAREYYSQIRPGVYGINGISINTETDTYII